MQMVNQVTPYGTLTYSKTGKEWLPATAVARNKTGDKKTAATGSVPAGASAYAASPSTTPANPTHDVRAFTRGGEGTTAPTTQTGTIPGQSATSKTSAQADLAGKGYYVPTYTATTTLSPEMQRLSKSNMASMQNLSNLARNRTKFLGNYLKKDIDTSGMPSLTRNFSKDRRRVERAMMKRMNPQFERDRAALEQRLADQGIGIGTEAYTREMGDYGRRVNDARTGVVLAGGQEQSRLAGLARDTRGAMLNEQFALRNQPLNEIAALLSGSQVNAPKFPVHTPGAMPTVDQAGLIQSNYKNQMDAYNAQMAQRQSLLSGGLGLLSKMITASDERLKEDIVRFPDGSAEYRYTWEPKGTRRKGYIAQDVAKVVPSAVRNLGPFLALDYSQLPEVV